MTGKGSGFMSPSRPARLHRIMAETPLKYMTLARRQPTPGATSFVPMYSQSMAIQVDACSASDSWQQCVRVYMII
eukprot:CAMPEP_0198681482 /NCGR_PEP_ID=MMETSP1468-20131203/6873_1 /TAXON_ID=1461545 /ORGANISM="Mantoniella sp, Strain CCMP1436" /LENGTH=74 /DNA_ID=CAMNT_0044423235 /DNA_START=970 /DNA_END=1194 /DNA_ORIENTATION=+